MTEAPLYDVAGWAHWLEREFTHNDFIKLPRPWKQRKCRYAAELIVEAIRLGKDAPKEVTGAQEA
jgi:hypothetical protein